MDWNGILGTVANVIGTALPFVLGLGKENTGAAGRTRRINGPQDVGPATLFDKAGTLQLGNFHTSRSKAAEDAPPILITFASPDGATQSSMTVQLDFGWSFDATPWLQQYHTGTVSVGLAEPPPASKGSDGVLEGLWTFVTNTVLSVERTITAVVNPTLTLQLRLEPNNNCVYIVAIGAVAILGTTYMTTARNNGGQNGSRAGLLERAPSKGADGTQEFIMALPDGVDYSEGIHDLTLQLPVALTQGNYATDQSVVFTPIPQEVRDAITARRKRA